MNFSGKRRGRSSTRQKAKQHIRHFDVMTKKFLAPYRQWIHSVYPPTVRSIQLCAALIFWNVVMTLEAAYFLVRWTLP